MTDSRRFAGPVLAAVVGAILVALLVMPYTVRRVTGGGDMPTGWGDDDRRDALLGEVARLLVPAPEGGWLVADQAGEPDPAVWVEAAAVAAVDQGSAVLDAALEAVAGVVAAEGADRGLVLAAAAAVSTGLGGGTAESLGKDLVERAGALVEARDFDGIAILLHLTRPLSPVASEARRALAAIFNGPPECPSLAASEPLPGPQLGLTLVSRRAAAAGLTCSGAAAIFDRARADPRWDSPIGAAELTDLLALMEVSDRAARRADLLTATDAWLRSGSPFEAGDAVPVALVMGATMTRLELAAPAGPHPEVLLRMANLVAARGGLPDTFDTPDLDISFASLTQLHAAGLLPAGAYERTLRAYGPLVADLSAEARTAFEVIVHGRLPSCESLAPVPVGAPARPTPAALVAREVARVGRLVCQGGDAGSLLPDTTVSGHPTTRLLTWWARLLAICAAQPESLMPPRDSAKSGSPTGGDSLLLTAESWMAAPVSACNDQWEAW